MKRKIFAIICFALATAFVSCDKASGSEDLPELSGVIDVNSLPVVDGALTLKLISNFAVLDGSSDTRVALPVPPDDIEKFASADVSKDGSFSMKLPESVASERLIKATDYWSGFEVSEDVMMTEMLHLALYEDGVYVCSVMYGTGNGYDRKSGGLVYADGMTKISGSFYEMTSNLTLKKGWNWIFNGQEKKADGDGYTHIYFSGIPSGAEYVAEIYDYAQPD